MPQSGKEVRALRQRVGLVFQNPEDQLFCSTVKEELAFAPKNAGFSGQELEDAIIYGLECVSLSKDFLTRNPIALSGGERRLVAIASVLAARPYCVVLDEPLAGLDASYQRKILAMLGKLRDDGRTIITITHDLKMALNYSDRILILKAGEKVSEASPHEILEPLMKILEPEAWPDVLKITAEIRRGNKNFPLIPTGSFIHKLDPRAKLFSLLFIISAVFPAKNPAWLAFWAVALIALVYASKIPARVVLKAARPVLFLVVFTFAFNLVMTYFTKSFAAAFWSAFFMAARLLVLMFFAVMLPLTTAPLELADGLDALLRPLEKFHFPAHESAMMIGMALRFIPLLMQEADKITRAQLSRGARLDEGNIFQKVRAFFPVLIPLFVIIFRRADDIAIAMEARGYDGGAGRTRRKPLIWRKVDTLAVIVSAAVSVLSLMA